MVPKCDLLHMRWYNTVWCGTVQYNTMQYNTIQYNTVQYNTMQCNTIQYNTIQCSILVLILGEFVPYHAVRWCLSGRPITSSINYLKPDCDTRTVLVAAWGGGSALLTEKWQQHFTTTCGVLQPTEKEPLD